MNKVIYTQDELKELSDDELLDILAKSWGVDDDKFEVWGELPADSLWLLMFGRGGYCASGVIRCSFRRGV